MRKIIRDSVAFTLETLQHRVGLGKDDVVLEIGAGVGRVGAAVAPLCREWLGVDVSENMVPGTCSGGWPATAMSERW